MTFQTLAEFLGARADAAPEKVFLFSEADGRRFTYREFDAAVNRAANMLHSLGVGNGDVVSLLLPNSAEYVIAYFACFKIGALAGPVNSLLKSEEIEYVTSNPKSKRWLINSQFSHLAADSDLPVPPAAGGLTSGDRGAGIVPKINFDNEAAATTGFSETLAPVDLDSGDDAIIIYTSGT